MEKQKSQSGYTLIEAIMFIGVIAMLAIAVINLINSMLDKYKKAEMVNTIKKIDSSLWKKVPNSINRTIWKIGRKLSKASGLGMDNKNAVVIMRK